MLVLWRHQYYYLDNMKKYLDIRNILIILLVASTALVAINPKGIIPNRTDYHYRVDSVPYPVHDTIPLEIEVPIDVKVFVEKLTEVPVYQKIDTAEIIRKYLAQIEHKDKLVLPSGQELSVATDATSKNKTISKILASESNTKIVRDTLYTTEPRKTTYYLGFDAKFDDPNYVKLLGLGLIITDK